jgi:hypothetical protein
MDKTQNPTNSKMKEKKEKSNLVQDGDNTDQSDGLQSLL